MPYNISNILGILFVSLWFVVAVIYAVRLLRSKFGPVQTVKAAVVDKNKVEAFSKYAGSGRNRKYVIVFEANGKKLSFYVSEFSYGGYRVGQTGILKYRGDRLIDFS